MKYFEKNNVHFFVSENEHCPAIVVDLNGQEPLMTFMGNTADMTMQDLNAFSVLLMEMSTTFLLHIKDPKVINAAMKQYTDVGLAQVSMFKTMLHGRKHLLRGKD